MSPAVQALLTEGDAASALCEGLGSLNVDTDESETTRHDMINRIGMHC